MQYQREVFIKLLPRLSLQKGETIVTPYNSVIVGTRLDSRLVNNRFYAVHILAMNHHNVTMSPANV